LAVDGLNNTDATGNDISPQKIITIALTQITLIEYNFIWCINHYQGSKYVIIPRFSLASICLGRLRRIQTR